MTSAIIEVTLVDVCAVASAVQPPARLALAPYQPSTSQLYAEAKWRAFGEVRIASLYQPPPPPPELQPKN